MQADHAVSREERQPVTEHVRHGEGGPRAGGERTRARRQCVVALEAYHRKREALGELAREMTVTGADVDDAGRPAREWKDDARERLDLRALPRLLSASRGPGRRIGCGAQWREHAELARASGERDERRRCPFGPFGMVAIDLERGEAIVVERSKERCPPASHERRRRVFLFTRPRIEHVTMLCNEARDRLPPPRNHSCPERFTYCSTTFFAAASDEARPVAVGLGVSPVWMLHAQRPSPRGSSLTDSGPTTDVHTSPGEGGILEEALAGGFGGALIHFISNSTRQPRQRTISGWVSREHAHRSQVGLALRALDRRMRASGAVASEGEPRPGAHRRRDAR